MPLEISVSATLQNGDAVVAVFETKEEKENRLCFEEMEAKARFEDGFIKPRKEDIALQPIISRKKVFTPRHHA